MKRPPDRRKRFADKVLYSLPRLLRGDGKSPEEIQAIMSGDPDLVMSSWNHYQSLTKAERDRLFKKADHPHQEPSLVPDPSELGLHQEPSLVLDHSELGLHQESSLVPDPSESGLDEQPEEASTVRRRGKGHRPSGESFTLVLSADLLAGCRRFAEQDQRSVASVIRLAIQKFLETSHVT